MIATGGSTAIVGNWVALRQAGATAREMLRAAAAEKLGLKANVLRQKGTSFTSPDGKMVATFGEVAAAAAGMSPPSGIRLKSPEAFKLIGRSHPRVDVPAKVRGAAQYGIDVRLPGMTYAALRQAPHHSDRTSAPEALQIVRPKSSE